MQIEIFKKHPEYEKYEISNYGRVRRKGRIRKQATNNSGYQYLSCSVEGKKTNRYVHRLVLQTFKPNRNPFFKEVDHINGDKADNRAVNLRWANRSLNVMHKGKGYYKMSGCKNRWRVDFSILKRRFTFNFDTEEEAAKCSKKYKAALFNQVKQHYMVMAELLRSS